MKSRFAFKNVIDERAQAAPELRFVRYQPGNELLEFGQAPFQLFHLIRILSVSLLPAAARRCAFCSRAWFIPPSVPFCPEILREIERIDGGDHRAISVLVNLEHGFHVLQRAFLTGATRGNHHLAKQVERESRVGRLGVFDDDLGQDQSRDVFVGRSIHHLHIVSLLQQLGHLFEVYVPAVGGVIEPPVFVFFDDYRLLRHYWHFTLDKTRK